MLLEIREESLTLSTCGTALVLLSPLVVILYHMIQNGERELDMFAIHRIQERSMSGKDNSTPHTVVLLEIRTLFDILWIQ